LRWQNLTRLDLVLIPVPVGTEDDDESRQSLPPLSPGHAFAELDPESGLDVQLRRYTSHPEEIERHAAETVAVYRQLVDVPAPARSQPPEHLAGPLKRFHEVSSLPGRDLVRLAIEGLQQLRHRLGIGDLDHVLLQAIASNHPLQNRIRELENEVEWWRQTGAQASASEDERRRLLERIANLEQRLDQALSLGRVMVESLANLAPLTDGVSIEESLRSCTEPTPLSSGDVTVPAEASKLAKPPARGHR
jgi:hypothetical protein